MAIRQLNKHRWSITARRFCSLLTCLLMMLAVAINRDGITTLSEDEQETEEHVPMGYAGPTPVTITIEGGRIVSIAAEANNETPEFFAAVEEQLLPRWNGMTIDEALAANIDAVSGATLSSDAVIQTVRIELQKRRAAGDSDIQTRQTLSSLLTIKNICVLVVILMAGVLPFFINSPRWRIVQLVLNVIVLGLWSGTFLSYSLIVNTLSNALNFQLSKLAPTSAVQARLETAECSQVYLTFNFQLLLALLLFVIAFIYPLFGKKGHYCSYVCPLGSLQELAGKSVKRTRRISPHTMKRLNMARRLLWAVLMLLMWSGVWFSWMNYELFVAFLFQQASPILIAVAVVFVILSCFLPRPYCNFVCPTGTLLKLSSNTK